MHSLLRLPMRMQKGLKPFRCTFIDGEIVWNGPWIVFALQRHRLSYVFQSKVLCIYNKVILMRFCNYKEHPNVITYPFYCFEELNLNALVAAGMQLCITKIAMRQIQTENSREYLCTRRPMLSMMIFTDC